MKGTIYVLKNLVNGKLYVGQTIGNPKYRYSKHLSDAFKRKDNVAVHVAMRKYGKQNFEMRIIEICELEEINEREMYWIKELDTYRKGYNRMLSSGTDAKLFDGIVEDFKSGMTITDLGKKHHSCRKTIARILKLAGIENTHLNQTRPPLSKEKYEEAKRRYLSGERLRSIEQALHTDRGNIAELLKKENIIVLTGKHRHPYKKQLPLNLANSVKLHKVDNTEPSQQTLEGVTTNPDECKGVASSEAKRKAI